MNEITLPPSPNWYLSSIIACTNDGTVAWGSRTAIVIAKSKDNSEVLDYSIIDKAHTDRVTSIAFSPYDKENELYRLVSTGDDNIVRVWNVSDLTKEMENTTLDSKSTAVAVDWSKNNKNLICCISGDGVLITWNIKFNASKTLTFGKLTATCLACCPHNEVLVSIGCKSGLIYIVDTREKGTIMYKLRGHDVEITSLSWCPVPMNIFEKEKRDLLLASSAMDKSIYLWKAGSDGRFQTQLSLPHAPLENSKHRSKNNFIAISWLAPTILLSSSPYGELLLWNLTGNAKKKFTPTMIHGHHARGIFAIAGITDNSNFVLEEVETEDWREKTNIKAIWTIAQDRQVLCCSLSKGVTSMDHIIPTQGGFVYCLSACPIDTSLLAIGAGDAMIRLWNLSEPHKNKIEMQTLWEKIKGKVRSLSWHPEKENLVAFGTDEGRIGIFDNNSKKPPHLCKQYFRRVIYTLGWGPAPNVDEYALYANGDGEIVYYPPNKLQENPIPVIERKDCTEFSWKPDYSLLAIGFNNGSISFLGPNLSKKDMKINALNKAIQCLVWHPESTMSDANVSPMKNYLAVAMNDTPITIFEVFDLKDSQEEESEKASCYKTVAKLNGHSDKVVGLAWSPHISGYLVSCSYDYTVQVWKVETQEIIATFTSHLQPVQCCMWSPLSQDYIITGSADFTLRIWKISNQTAITSVPTQKNLSKIKKTKKKKAKVASENQAVQVDESKSKVNNTEAKVVENGTENRSQQSVEKSEDVGDTKSKKKKTKKTNLFPGYAEISNNNKLWCASVRNLLTTVKTNGQSNESAAEKCNEKESNFNEEQENDKANEKIPTLFGKKKDLEDALNYEKKILYSQEQLNSIVEIDQWADQGLKESLLEVMKKNKLNDHCAALAASISKEFWEKICEAYAAQLVFEENPQKAVSYLLCINKVHEAITVLLTAKMYKYAYVLAASRLDPTDKVIKDILTQWANSAQQVGNFQTAVECYIKLGEYSTAAKLLARRKDVDSLILAIDVAKLANDSDLSISLAEKALMQALIDSDVTIAKTIIKENPQLQYYETDIDVFDELNKVVENVNDDSIINWLKGTSTAAVIESLSNRFEKCSEKYSLLLQKELISLPVSQKMILINVSRQLALALLTNSQSQQLQHIVRAFEIIMQHEKANLEVMEDKPLPLINYLLALENKILIDSSNIFKSNENNISVSLRAYLCHAIIDWFNKSTLSKKQISECTDLLLPILKNCIKDLLNKESVKFWTTANEIRKLESQLSTAISKMQQSSGDDADEVDETKTIIERLDQLRNNKNQFLSNRVSSPNPLFSYGIINEFISKISNDEVSQEVNELVKDAWSKAIS